MNTKKKFFAEGLGTFALVLFGCGAATIASVSQSGPEGIGLLGISLAFGFSVVVMAYAIGPISGCHINPAISIAMLVAGKLSAKDTVGYVISQCIGAILAAGVLYLLASGSAGFTMPEWGLGSNGWGEGYLGNYNMTSALIAEFVFTFLFLLVIFGTTAKNASPLMAGLAIGISLALIHMVAIPITGTSVNPARSLGPALFAGGKAMSQLWLFIVTPIAGGICAALVRNLFIED
ncbi:MULTISPECIES: aquaporin Z [Dokdonia]|uniref:Porin n=1 Tax=Dokdonia donghaensis DSW-1 TaxID=1300343 RepID=A0A0A2H0Q8_9FLAO|nr:MULTISPECIES: aquaporin Z [Dokdonia]ANH61647.1 Aquaporin Z [Dokdonia donghaensis DSW-1]EAQ38743.1 MIP family channel protein [Dokdonia sp. MED134]KGO06240.1 porin [Dokdonia donghaensis DSW-1]